AEHLADDRLGVDGLDRAPDREGDDPGDRRRGAVRRPVGLEVGLDHAGPQPAGALLQLLRRSGVRAGHVENDVAVLVQAAGVVVVDLARRPAGAVPRLPDQRRVARVDADALDATAEPEVDRAGRDRLG